LLFADDGEELDVVIVVLPTTAATAACVSVQQTKVTRGHFASVAKISLQLVGVLGAPLLLLLL
jgi:hypothetical protein